MITVVILGFGNVGQHLYRILRKAEGVTLVQCYTRSLPSNITEKDVPFTSKITALKNADLYIIALPDDIIARFSEKLPFQNRWVVHTSGSVALDALSNKNKKGVFYPLQSFSATSEIDFTNIPICIEAENKEGLELVNSLGNCISEKVVTVSSEKRRKLHLAAVFVNNFANHMYAVSEAYSEKNNIDFELLQPLILETAKKVMTHSPQTAQTGPAKRGDRKTIEKHIELLANTQWQKLYITITQSIEETHGKKL